MSKKDKLSIESYKGVRDFYPEDQAFLNYLFATCRKTVQKFGYVEYHASILEPSELYKAKGAENEEIINEQTYSFTDRGGREVTLRPEMTPTVARMVSAKRRELGFPLRLFSIPNLFRYERPQRGRLREHWQLNVDLFGSQSLASDAEILMTAHQLMLAFGATESDFTIKLGSRHFLNSIIAKYALSTIDGKRLLLLLDRKSKITPEEFADGLVALGVDASLLSPQEPPADIADILLMLEHAGITNAVFDPSIVRGFNYYTGVVFEVFDTHPQNNRALFGGGRYDNLTAMFDDEPVPGVGFGMGDATIENFLSVRQLLPVYIPPTRVYIAVTSVAQLSYAQEIAQVLRKNNINVANDFGEKKLSDQIKTAAKHKIPYLIVIGEDEEKTQTMSVRSLDSGEEVQLEKSTLVEYFTANKPTMAAS